MKNKTGLSKKGRRTLLQLLVCFCIAFIVYRVIIELGQLNVIIFYVGTSLYALTIAVLFCVYYVKNGFTLSNNSALMPPADMTADERTAFIESSAKKKRQARTILFILASMALTVMLDYITLMLENFFG